MTTTTLRRLASSAVPAVAASLLCGCATHPAGPISTHDLGIAQSFRLFSVYWVGRSFDGVPLTAADTQRDYDAVAGERVYYGNCDKQKSIVSTAGCKLPLEIATVEYRMLDSRGNEGLGTRTDTAIRGVPAVIFDGGKSIQLYTAELAIDIYADSSGRALQAAESVVPMNRPKDPDPLVLHAPQFGKDVDPRLLAIERELSVSAARAAAAKRAAADAARRVASGQPTSGGAAGASPTGTTTSAPAAGTTAATSSSSRPAISPNSATTPPARTSSVSRPSTSPTGADSPALTSPASRPSTSPTGADSPTSTEQSKTG